eukprot:COSAG04_NODE_2765_length_3621_cov_47.223169_2_plen_897_part_00
MQFRDNPQRTILLEEKFNVSNVSRLLLSDLLDTVGKRTLQKYLKKLEGGKVEVAYSNSELGRLEAKMTHLKKNEVCATQMNLWNVMKAVGCKDIYTDVDINNCHPTLLCQLFKHEKCPTEYLSMYVQDRDKLMAQMGVTKHAIKALMFGLIYNSGHFNEKKWMKEHGVKQMPRLFYDMQHEVQNNTAKVLEKYHEFRQLAKKRKQPGYWNLDGSALSYLAQQMEKTCLLSMYDFMEQEGWTVGALIHDGMHVEGKVPPEVLSQCSGHVFDSTGLRVKLETKPFEDYEDRLESIHIVEDDYEASQIVLKAMESSEHDLVVSRGRMYFREDDLYTVDASKHHDDIQAPLMNYINQFTLFKETATGRPVSVSRNYTSAKSVMSMVFNHARKDYQFAETMAAWCKGKLCYANGYWDFEARELKPYENDVMTTIRIDRDLDLDVSDADIKEVYLRVLDPIFTGNTELRDFWLKLMARVMAGHVEDKQWMVMMGERNSGKGVLVLLFLAAFGAYATITDANHFLAKRGSGDAALDMKWAVSLDMVRVVFTNEIEMEGEKEAKLDGAMMKKLASGGDVIECRGLFEKAVKFVLQCQFCLMLNDMPEATSTDAMSNCHEFHMNTQFVPHEPRPDGIVKQYKADDSIKDYVKSERCTRAFTKILFDHYDTKKPEVPKEIIESAKDNEAESDLSRFERMIDFTNDKEDFMTVREFDRLRKLHLSVGVSAKKTQHWLKKKGVTQSFKRVESFGTSKNTRVYRGIRRNLAETAEEETIDAIDEANTETNDIEFLDDINVVTPPSQTLAPSPPEAPKPSSDEEHATKGLSLEELYKSYADSCFSDERDGFVTEAAVLDDFAQFCEQENSLPGLDGCNKDDLYDVVSRQLGPRTTNGHERGWPGAALCYD